jgi:hypothetical protein
MKLLSEGRCGDAQYAIRGDVLDRDASQPKLIALGNGSDDESALLPINESAGLRRRGVNHNLKISPFLEVRPYALPCFVGQFLAIVIFSTLSRLEHPLSYCISVMNLTFDSEVV